MKLLGIDSSVAPLAQNVQSLNTGGQTSNLAVQTAVRSADYLQQSLSDQAQQSGANMRGLSTAVGLAAKGQNAVLEAEKATGGMMGGLAQLAGVAGKIYEGVQKKNAEAKNQILEGNALLASEELAKLKVEFQDIMRNDAGGKVEAERRIGELVARYDLSPKDRAALIQGAYGELVGLQGEQAKRIQAESDKIKAGKQEEIVTRSSIELSAILSDIGATDDPDVIKSGLDKFNTNLSQILNDPNLSDSTKQLIINANVSKLEASVFRSQDARAKAANMLSGMREFQQVASALKAQYEQDGDYAAYTQGLLEAQQTYGISSELRDAYDPVKQLQRANDAEKARFETEELRQKRYISDQDAQDWSQLEIGSIAAELVNDPAKEASFRAQAKSSPNSTFMAKVLGVVDAHKESQTARQAASKEGADLQIAIAKMREGNTKGALSTIMRSTELQQAVGFFAQIQALQGGKTMTEAQIQASPEYQELQQQLLQDRARILAAMEGRLKVINEGVLNKERALQPYGFVGGKFNDESYRAGQMRREERLRQMSADKKAQSSEAGGTTPNFNVLRVNRNGRPAVLPFRADFKDLSLGQDNFMEQRGNRRHHGEDMAPPVGTPLIAVMGGKVTRVQDDGSGYGKWIEVKYNDGTSHLYAHLDSWNVRIGQTVQPGQVIAKTGNTGTSTGPHLHWEVRNSRDELINPWSWATDVGSKVPEARQPRGMQGNETHTRAPVPKNALRLSKGYLYQGKFFRYDAPANDYRPVSYTGANPMRSSGSSTDRRAYPKRNDPTANYGYADLAKDRAFARKVADVADRLNIPAQWLVDVMAFESGGRFNPGQWNIGGAPAVGLIQFHEDATGSGVKRIGGRDYRLTDIARMSRVEQMELVYQYLKPFGNSITKSPRHLLASIFGGNPDLPLGIGDRNITLKRYLGQLGRHAGRRYYDSNGQPIPTEQRVQSGKVDRRLHSSCTTCQAIQASNSGFIPHYRQLGDGASLSDYIA